MYKQHTVFTRLLTSTRYYLRMPIIVAGGASCSSMFLCFPLSEELMVCMVILYLCIKLKWTKGRLLFGVFCHIYKREDDRIFFQKKNHIGQSYINSSESRIRSATISE